MHAEGALLLTPAVAGPHRTNFTEGSGTIRLWYSPTAWASASAGGTGPGAWATLFELAQTNTVEHPFGFALSIDPFGTNLVAAVNTETGAVTLVQTAISWSTGQWHQIAFVYDGTAVELFVDDNSDTISFTLPTWPGSSVWNQSAFSLGSGFDGSLLAMGQLDEIHTFSYPLSTNYLTWSYQLYAPIAALGPLPDDLESGGGQTRNDPVPAPCGTCSTNGSSGDTNSYASGWTTNAGLKFASNPAPYIVGGTNFVTVLDEASPFKAYQIFQATQILGSTLITTNLVWTNVANGAIGVSNFTLPLPVPSTNVTDKAFFIAAEAKDSDTDGFSDAYEYLVLHTNPNQFNDTNSDGLSDAQFVVEWDMRTLDGTNAQGVLFYGNGFYVLGNKGNDPQLLKIFFDQRYRGYPLKDFPRDTPQGIRVVATNIDSTLTHYKIIYDRQRVRVFRGTNALPLLGGRTNTIPGIANTTVEWLDNMTDAVGSNGPVNLTVPVSNMQISNVTVQTLPFSNPSRYTYLGSIGNTSSNFFGPSMRAAYQNIKKMVIHDGANGFSTVTYNENLRELQKFDPLNPQTIVSNFGNKVITTSTLITNMTVSNNVLYVRYDSDRTDWYNVTNCAFIGTGGSNTFPMPGAPTVSNPSIGRRLDWSKSPVDGTIAVYDANIDVVRVYNANSNGLVYSIGITNGYSNGPSILIPSTDSSFRSQVKLGAMWWDKTQKKTNATVCFQQDGKLWVSDTATSRMLRFTTNGGCDAWFMFVPHTYSASADPNDPQRVFNEYLEFRVDYSTLTQTGGWVLTNYWGFNITPRPDTTDQGLYNVTTVSNHTYALIWDPAANGCLQSQRIVELTNNSLRATSTSNLVCNYRIQPDGALHKIDKIDSTAYFTRQVITNIAGNGDPLYCAATTIATVAYTNGTNPAAFDFKIAGSRIIVFQESNLHTNNHLGAISNAANSVWLWQTMPTGPLNGRGQFDLDAQTAGEEFIVVDDEIFALYRGEFWHGVSQANQILHYKTDGTFVGQFGMPATEDTMVNAIGSASNMASLSYTKANGIIYLFTNDEKGRGTQIWRIEP